jgi:hypothetical protein
MNVLLVSLLAVVGAVGAPPSSDQRPPGNQARINACTVFTRDMVATITTDKKVLSATPKETPAGVNGSQCDIGGIELHLDTMADADRMRKSPRVNWVPLSGVGETAYFHNVQNYMVELIVWSGSHHFGILMEVPVGSKGEQFKPKLIELANQIVPKLK